MPDLNPQNPQPTPNQTPGASPAQGPQGAQGPVPNPSTQPNQPAQPGMGTAGAQPMMPRQPQSQPQPQPMQKAMPQGQPLPNNVQNRPQSTSPMPAGARPPLGRPNPLLQANRRPPNPRRIIYGALGFFGCSIFLFVALVMIFVSQTSPNGDNALARQLGLDTGTFINDLIGLVSVVFGIFSIALFIVAVVGLFRTAMARKDDKEARKKGLKLAGVSGFLLIFLVSLWVGIYIFLSSRKVAAPLKQASSIVTDPAVPLGLTAPVVVKFDGTKLPLDTRNNEILSFLWDFGDGQTSTLQSPSHLYADKGKNNGRFDVKLTVTLKNKTTAVETTQNFTDNVTISDTKINADFTVTPNSGPAPLTVSFDASASSVPDGQIQNYDWDFQNKNLFTDASGVKVQHTFEQVGTYTVNLRITDNNLKSTVVSKDIVVQGPNVPTAVINVPTNDGHYYTGTQYSFLGEQSTSPAGKIVKYEWDFGDQTPQATTRTATHVYKTDGDYQVTLKVTDEKGGEGQTTQKITIEKAVGAPLAAFTTIPAPAKASDGYISGTVPFEVTFDASASKQDNGSIVDYKWDFDGDGKQDDVGKQVTYVYKTAGTYNATLTVFDAANKQATTSYVVKVLPQGLQARVVATPVDGVKPLTVTFDASGSSYPSGQIVSYEWDFGDGSPKRIDVSKVVYQYTQIGTFNAKVTAIASDGSRSSVTTVVNVRPVPLTACFKTSTQQGPAPLTLEFDPGCSAGTIVKYSWDFGDGQTSLTRKPMHTFNTPGSYDVKLQVSDNQNVIDTFDQNILVTGTVNQ